MLCVCVCVRVFTDASGVFSKENVCLCEPEGSSGEEEEEEGVN